MAADLKTPIIVRDKYTIYLEPDGEGNWLVHADIHQWNRTVKEQLTVEWEMLRILYSGFPFFALHRPSEHSNPEKHKKFLTLMDFVKLKDWTIEGEDCEIWICEYRR